MNFTVHHGPDGNVSSIQVDIIQRDRSITYDIYPNRTVVTSRGADLTVVYGFSAFNEITIRQLEPPVVNGMTPQ